MNGNGSDGSGPKPPMGLHFLSALSHGALAVAHLAFGPNPDDETEDEQPAPRRRRRVTSGKRAGSGSCCNGSRRKKPATNGSDT